MAALSVSNHLVAQIRERFDCEDADDETIRALVREQIAGAHEQYVVIKDQRRPNDGPSTVYLTDDFEALIVRSTRGRGPSAVHLMGAKSALYHLENGLWEVEERGGRAP